LNSSRVLPLVAKLLAVLILTYGLVVLALVLFEPALVYPRPTVDRAQLGELARGAGASELTVVTSDGLPLYGWRLGSGGPLVLYFSGNGSTVGAPLPRYQRLVDAGYSVLHVNYRGYPGSTGEPSEPGLIRDALAAWDRARVSHEAREIVIMGRSLGGGVALALAASLDEQPRALVIESSFTSAVAVARETWWWLPVGWLMTNRWDSLGRAGELDLPALVLHSQHDEMIPVEHGRRMAATLGATYVELSGLGHNDDLLGQPAAWRAFEELAGPDPL
jgi:pimeloyl-ACP methyl ester carboxylesterase